MAGPGLSKCAIFKHILKTLFMTQQGGFLVGVFIVTITVSVVIPPSVATLEEEEEVDTGPSSGAENPEDIENGKGDIIMGLCSTSGLTICGKSLNEKIHSTDSSCAETGKCQQNIILYGGIGEFEAFKFLISTTSDQSVTVVHNQQFSFEGAEIVLYQASYTDNYEEDLAVVESNSQITLSTSQNNVLWGVIKIPYGTTPTKNQEERYKASLQIGQDTIVIELYVFDFEIPKDVHYYSQLNIASADLDSDNDKAKWILLQHRFTPKSVPWPSGFKYSITWDSSSNPSQCSAFYDEPDEGEAYSIKTLSKRYILGDPEWNEYGMSFPRAMAFQFESNSQTRPTTFCGESLGSDQCGTSAYNTKYIQYITALRDYLSANDMLEKSYVYVQNEPQDSSDYDVAICLCKMYKQNVPDLKIAISEEAKSQLADECGYDIWIANIPHYEHEYALERLANNGEETYIYSLDHDDLPYINPIRITSHGMDCRMLTWVSWKLRIRGYAFYDFGRYFNSGVPTVVSVLLRESFEDYEYLYLLNDNALPSASSNSKSDTVVDQVATNLKTYSTDSEGFMEFRRNIGFYLEGTLSHLPTFTVSSTAKHSKGSYYINFQDLTESPTDDPLVVDGNTYTKFGGAEYSDDEGLGWKGENIGNTAIVLFRYNQYADGCNEAQKSFIYDDYGRAMIFYFSIENGEYTVSTGIGYPGYERANDLHRVIINGETIVDDRVVGTSPTYVETVSSVVTVTNQLITVEYGGYYSESSTGSREFDYTFIQFLIIEPTS